MEYDNTPVKTDTEDAISRRAFMAAGSAGVAMAAHGPVQAAPEEKTMKDSAIITLVQLRTEGDLPRPVDRMEACFEQAARDQADLIVFPEYVLGDGITRYHEDARRFFAMVRDHHINAIVGCIETHGDRYATTAYVVNREGDLVGRYLKSHPASGPAPHWWPPMPGHDREARGILGSQFKVFHLDFGPIGILQCYDGYFPEAWGCTSYAGAEIILWINGRDGMVEDSHCICAAQCYGCVVGANITEGFNTGFAGPGCVTPVGPSPPPEQARLYPRVSNRGDAVISARVDLASLRRHRKHLRTMHQRRPEMYGLLTQDVKMWQDYPDIPWDYPECANLVNRSQLD